MAKVFGINWNYTRTDVIRHLKKIDIPKQVVSTEKKLETYLFKELKLKFDKIHRQYNLQGVTGMKVDIDLGGGEIAIELKLAKQLSSAASRQKLKGQIADYGKTYGRHIIVFVAGSKKDKDNPEFRVLKKDLKMHYDVHFMYKSVK